MGVVTEREYEIHYYESNYRLECKDTKLRKESPIKQRKKDN